MVGQDGLKVDRQADRLDRLSTDPPLNCLLPD